VELVSCLPDRACTGYFIDIVEKSAGGSCPCSFKKANQIQNVL